MTAKLSKNGEEKNVFFLADAFKRLKQHIPSAQLLVIGDGPASQKMKQVLAKELGYFEDEGL